jgi:two-component system osmolarity sensor histidine kinase EnvZ
MKLQLAMMPESADTQAMRADIDDMEQMVEGYLSFMRGEGDEPSAACDLVSLLNDVVAQARRQNFNISLEAPAAFMLEIRPKALERALTNLVENARKYAHRAQLTLHVLDHAAAG